MVNAKNAIKSASFMVVFGFLSLSGCADTSLPSWFTGEPDESVLKAPRVVGSPASLKETAFPNLATVPPKPSNFTTNEERREHIEEMTSDRLKAQAAKARLESAQEPVIVEPELLWQGVVLPQGDNR